MNEFSISEYQVTQDQSDGWGRAHPAALLWFAQEAAGDHCKVLGVTDDALGGLFWAVLRYRVEVTRMPRVGETVRVKTWPLPTTKVAFPRAAVGYDKEGNQLFCVTGLWVLMDEKTRQMVLPGRSGVDVPGNALGGELPVPAGLKALPTQQQTCRAVAPEDLDKNRHMNNTRYIVWATDLLEGAFTETHTLKAFTACYFAEARLGDELSLGWSLSEDGSLYFDSYRKGPDPETKPERIFSAQMEFDGIM